MSNQLDYIKYATNNKLALNNASECACIYCLRKYHPSLIVEWVEETAICPYCGIDAIVPNIINDDNLIKWHQQGFN